MTTEKEKKETKKIIEFIEMNQISLNNEPTTIDSSIRFDRPVKAVDETNKYILAGHILYSIKIKPIISKKVMLISLPSEFRQKGIEIVNNTILDGKLESIEIINNNFESLLHIEMKDLIDSIIIKEI